MLFRTSRKLSASELQWPLGKDRESDGERRQGEEKREEEGVFAKREDEEDDGMRVDVERRPGET